jgi:hypothetical protein
MDAEVKISLSRKEINLGKQLNFLVELINYGAMHLEIK